MKLVRENIRFKRGIKPKEAMDLGYEPTVKLETNNRIYELISKGKYYELVKLTNGNYNLFFKTKNSITGAEIIKVYMGIFTEEKILSKVKKDVIKHRISLD